MSQLKDFHIQGPQINQFNNIAPRAVPRSAFKRDFTRRTTFDAGQLIPIFVDEIIPGDDVNLKLTAFTRLSTPIKPIMDNLYLETFFFFVPNRLVWDNWEKFQGQQTNPTDSVAYTIPVLDKTKAPMSTTGFLVGSNYDYLGLPTQVTGLTGVSALYNRAINLIWNEWFRDENISPSLPVPTGDGPDDPGTANSYSTPNIRYKRKDYFTSCLPWPQKGTAVSVPLGTSAPIVGPTTAFSIPSQWYRAATATSMTATGSAAGTTVQLGAAGSTGDAITGQLAANFFNGKGVTADLSSATAVTINTLRQAALYQQILELDARGGTRYVESIYSRFGVISPDFRLQRPELIGQGSTRINVYAVPQTAPTVSGQTPQGNLAAFGTSVINGDHGCRYAATEHGMILGFANVRADLTYQQGLPKMFTRSTRLDFYEPLLNGLGEQSVLNQEIYAQGTSADQNVFGYQERFAEYRFKNSEITGQFRSTYAQTLDIWHLSQSFGSLPLLSPAFMTDNPPVDRVVAVPSEPNFLSDIFYSYMHVRPLPIRSNPGINIL